MASLIGGQAEGGRAPHWGLEDTGWGRAVASAGQCGNFASSTRQGPQGHLLHFPFEKETEGKALNMGYRNWISLLASLQMYWAFLSVFLAFRWISWEAV